MYLAVFLYNMNRRKKDKFPSVLVAIELFEAFRFEMRVRSTRVYSSSEQCMSTSERNVECTEDALAHRSFLKADNRSIRIARVCRYLGRGAFQTSVDYRQRIHGEYHG